MKTERSCNNFNEMRCARPEIIPAMSNQGFLFRAACPDLEPVKVSIAFFSGSEKILFQHI